MCYLTYHNLDRGENRAPAQSSIRKSTPEHPNLLPLMLSFHPLQTLSPIIKLLTTDCSRRGTLDSSWDRLSEARVSGVPGIWRGEGLGEGWEREGQFTSNLRPRWTDPVTARRVPSKWRGVKEKKRGARRVRGARGMSKGKWVKQEECAMYIQSVFMYIMNVWTGEWYQLYI